MAVPDGPFDPVRTMASFSSSLRDPSALSIRDFAEGCLSISKILGGMGLCMKLAERDIIDKTGILQLRASAFAADAADPRGTSLQALVADEVSRGVQGRKDSTFVSASRSVLRLMWFLDFVTTLLRGLLEDGEGKSLSQLARGAYDSALAPHHPWLLRQTVSAGLLMLPSKDAFLE